MEETKKCPYCGKEILAVAKKCRYCGKWLDGRSNNPITSNKNEATTRQESAPTVKQSTHLKLTAAEKLEQAIRSYANSKEEKNKRIRLLDEANEDVVSNHQYATIGPDEKVFMVVDKATLIGGGTGLVFTNRNLYYRLKQNFTGMFKTGSIPIDRIMKLEIGEERRTLGNYSGSEFIVNGENLGRVYLISEVNYFDVKMYWELTKIFDAYNL